MLDASGGLVLPGFIQTHVHLCQTLFRGFADDLALIDWLRTRIWPMEAAHTPASLRASARLAACELLSSGTTAVLTMETVHDTEAVFEEVEASGLRAVVGKCLMDADAAVPRRLLQTARAAIDESLDLHRRWDGAAGGRLRAAFAPRFAVSCSRGLLEEVGSLSASGGVLVHTHASEQQAEIAIVERQTGKRNIEYFEAIGLASERLCLAHCVWVDEREQDILAARRVKVLHCPGSNLKLGSGIAPVAELRRRGVSRVAWRRRRGLQQPPGHVRGDAPRGGAAGHAARAGRAARPGRGLDGDARGRTRPRPGRPRSGRSSPASAPT